ncbi:MAG: LemA family protein [Alphaproteobacteria bacterium]|nr:LemA family protein [Alphaproteobacteria bacterium]MBV9370308.1 LemA family protein [Alphaproteobacteria bacterium]MBV9901162.1 LemA family protein [Alphaproteobacteria bacterium]
MNRTRFATLLLAPAAAASLAGCGVNSIPTAEESAKAKWADVQAAYQRRANLIPNLVATVKGAAASEQNILVGVTQARADATKIQLSGDQIGDPAAMQRYADAQNRLTLSLQRLQEAYPQLRSQENFQTLMSQVEGTENRINISIQDYNKAVQDYNTEIRTFPSVIGAKVFYGAKPMAPYQATTPNAEQAPTIDFGNSAR